MVSSSIEINGLFFVRVVDSNDIFFSYNGADYERLTPVLTSKKNKFNIIGNIAINGNRMLISDVDSPKGYMFELDFENRQFKKLYDDDKPVVPFPVIKSPQERIKKTSKSNSK